MLDRALVTMFRPAYRMMSHAGWRGAKLPTDDDVVVKGILIPLEGRTLTAKIFEPTDKEAASQKPMLVYFHGGGLCTGGIDTTHYNCLLVYAAQLQCTVVAVDYRLAPEHAVPAGADDCVDATQWLLHQAQEQALPFPCNGKVVVGGDSAGGMLSIVTGCAVPNLSGAILFYPNTHYDTGAYASWKEMGTGHVLRADVASAFFRSALGMNAHDFCEKHKDSEEGVLLLAKVFPLLTLDATVQANMPPTFLVTCDYDMLKDEGAAFQKKLDKLGVKNEHHHYMKEEHGFMCTSGMGDNFDDSLSKLKTWFDALES